MKRWLAALLAITLLLGCLPASAMAANKKSKRMNDGVPVWTEETVRDYARAYITGKVMNTLYGYFDLQIRRYIPMVTYENMLVELEWITGAYQGLGSYTSYETQENQTKTHILHLCMEKTDLDMYFTHKNEPDDWEVMALEFVPSGEEALSDGSDMLVDATGEDWANQAGYDEVQVMIGKSGNTVPGTLTIPAEADASNPVPGCVLVHDFGAMDRDATMGGTAFFADLAHALAEMGIASIRYDHRSYVYGIDADATAVTEVIEDAIGACQRITSDSFIDPTRVVLVGHGFGAMLAPEIATEADGLFTAMVMIAGAPRSFLKQVVDTVVPETAKLNDAELQALRDLTQTFGDTRKSKVAEMSILGRNGLYFFELDKLDQIKLIKKLKLPTYIVQGDSDPCVSEDDGWRAYAELIGDGATYMSFKSFRGLNHLLMSDAALLPDGRPDYSAKATLDAQAGKNISQWILNLLMDEE